jgi:hypothetical protein
LGILQKNHIIFIARSIIDERLSITGGDGSLADQGIFVPVKILNRPLTGDEWLFVGKNGLNGG